MTNRQVQSKQRVADHGEVFTSDREIDAMLDLVKSETERIESRFLEPACGTGNFLASILERKLTIIESRYAKSQLEYDRNLIIGVSSIYGIEIQKDNALKCRQRLFDLICNTYSNLFGTPIKEDLQESIKFILKQNIVIGDALNLMTITDDPKPIVFSEWSPVNGSMIKRRDFNFHALIKHEAIKDLPLFSDLGEDVFIPTPVREFPIIHYLKVAYAEQTQS